MREINGDDYSFLRQKTAPAISKNQPVINVADLFCGVGGISLGILEACRTMGFGFRISLAIDHDKSAAKCFKKNFSPLIFCDDSVADVMHMPLGSAFSEWERTIASRIN